MEKKNSQYTLPIIILGSTMALSLLWNRFAGCLNRKTYVMGDEDKDNEESKKESQEYEQESRKERRGSKVSSPQPSDIFEWSGSESESHSDDDDEFCSFQKDVSDYSPSPTKPVELRRMSTILHTSAQRTLARMEKAIRKSSNGRVSVGMREVCSLNHTLKRLKTRADKSVEYEKALTEAIQAAPELFDSNFKEFMIDEFAAATKRRSSRSSNTELMMDMLLRRKSSMRMRRMRSLMDMKMDPRLSVADKHSQELEKLMQTYSSWTFDIFKLEKLSELGALVILGEAIFEEFALLEELNCNKEKFRNYLVEVETMYRKVPYHGSLHGADVCQGVFYFLSHGGLSIDLEVDHTFAVLLAALVHDVAHPGRNNKFLVQTQNSLALTYNDRSPLENMHAATAFRLLNKPENNFTEHLESSRMKAIRMNIIAMILATDNDHHSSLMGEVDEYLHQKEKDITTLNDGRLLKLEVALHAADLSNPAKAWDLYMLWTGRVMEEFYVQGDQERDIGLPITYAFDRENPVPMPKFQQGFINFIVQPLYRAFNCWDGIEIDECIDQLSSNLRKWHAMDAQERRRSSSTPVIEDDPEKGPKTDAQEVSKSFVTPVIEGKLEKTLRIDSVETAP